MMKKTLLLGCLLLIAISLSACEINWKEKNNNSGDEETNNAMIDEDGNKDGDAALVDSDDFFSKTIENPKIALVAPDGSALALIATSSTFGCNDSIVFQEIDGEFTPKQILEEMFSFRDSDENDDDWYYNVFLGSTLIVDSLEIDEAGVVTLQLLGELRTGGACDIPRVFAQIGNTLKAMNEELIKDVVVFINGELATDFLSEKD